MRYLMVLPVRFAKLSEHSFACESAFVTHLREKMRLINPPFDRMHIAASSMSDADYQRRRTQLTEFMQGDSGIHIQLIYSSKSSRLTFLFTELIPCFFSLLSAVRKADFVHSGISSNLYKPVEILTLIIAVLMKKKTLFMVDIDHRDGDLMRYRSGEISSRVYFLSRYAYTPLKNLQIRWAVKHCSLVMLKGQRLVSDFGRNNSHTVNFYDTAHSRDLVIPHETLNAKVEKLREPGSELRLVYFGRLVAYKGVDDAIQAVSAARALGAPIRLDIIGDGDQLPRLKDLANSLGVADLVTFLPGWKYGHQLFDRLYNYHVLLATPKSPDTPRSAFDGMAAGMALLAYNTDYYRELEPSGAVELVPWLAVDDLAEKLISLDSQREILISRIQSAVEFGRRNCQEAWLEKRVALITSLFR